MEESMIRMLAWHCEIHSIIFCSKNLAIKNIEVAYIVSVDYRISSNRAPLTNSTRPSEPPKQQNPPPPPGILLEKIRYVHACF